MTLLKGIILIILSLSLSSSGLHASPSSLLVQNLKNSIYPMKLLKPDQNSACVPTPGLNSDYPTFCCKSIIVKDGMFYDRIWLGPNESSFENDAGKTGDPKFDLLYSRSPNEEAESILNSQTRDPWQNGPEFMAFAQMNALCRITMTRLQIDGIQKPEFRVKRDSNYQVCESRNDERSVAYSCIPYNNLYSQMIHKQATQFDALKSSNLLSSNSSCPSDTFGTCTTGDPIQNPPASFEQKMSPLAKEIFEQRLTKLNKEKIPAECSQIRNGGGSSSSLKDSIGKLHTMPQGWLEFEYLATAATVSKKCMNQAFKALKIEGEPTLSNLKPYLTADTEYARKQARDMYMGIKRITFVGACCRSAFPTLQISWDHLNYLRSPSTPTRSSRLLMNNNLLQTACSNPNVPFQFTPETLQIRGEKYSSCFKALAK
jgi:hypothetical protein